MSKNLTTRIKHKYDDAATWASQGWTSKVGEIYVYKPDSDYNYPRMKVGDGVHIVADLPFVEIGDYTPKLITISTVPSQSGTITYNGSSKTPSWSNYDSAKLTLGGTVTGTNAGDYYATFTPKAGYCWSDGSTTAKSVKWTIGKATPTLSLNKTSITLNDSTKSTTVTVTTNSTGTITATPSPTTYVTTSVSSKTITVTGKTANGSTTVTVTVAATTNYNARSTTFSVTTSFTQVDSSLGMNSWTTIQSIAKTGNASQYWAVGDSKEVYISYTLTGTSINKSLSVFIVGFNRSGNSIDFQCFKDPVSGRVVCLVDDWYNSNYSSINNGFSLPNGYYDEMSGMWEDSYWYDYPRCKQLIYNAMSNLYNGMYDSSSKTTTIRNVMKTISYDVPLYQVSVDYSEGSSPWVDGYYSDYRDATMDSKLVIPSPFDLWDTVDLSNVCSWADETGGATATITTSYYKGTSYAYYKNGNSRTKYRYNSTSSTAYYWLRGEVTIESINMNYQQDVITAYSFYTNGNYIYGTPDSTSYGVCPIFRVG